MADVPPAPDAFPGWETYVDPGIRYSFRHPAGSFVIPNASGTRLTLLPAPVAEAPVPDRTIVIEDGDARFRAWEDFDIPYFKGLVSTFEFR